MKKYQRCEVCQKAVEEKKALSYAQPGYDTKHVFCSKKCIGEYCEDPSEKPKHTDSQLYFSISIFSFIIGLVVYLIFNRPC